MKIAVVIPTYNEIGNIEGLVGRIFSLEIDGLGIVAIDDNSPDGTGNLLETLRENYPDLHVIHRAEKLGLGTAYLDGFKKAISLGAEYVLEMDADFSHDFLMIPTFVDFMERYDLVVGSRYISEGKIINWNLSRKVISRLGNFYARTILNIPVKDLTTGYKCYRKKALEEIAFGDISSIGYVFQVETTYRIYRKGFLVHEIPITFCERRIGKSKFNFKIIWESFWKVASLRFSKKG